MTSLADTKHLFIERFMAHRILYLAKTTRGSRDSRVLRVRRDYKLRPLASRELYIVLKKITTNTPSQGNVVIGNHPLRAQTTGN